VIAPSPERRHGRAVSLVLHNMTTIQPERTDALHPRKRFKASELPISSATKSAIDQLVNSYKKHGEFDSLRKKIWAEFEGSVGSTWFSLSAQAN
jgi:hypothetical protein